MASKTAASLAAGGVLALAVGYSLRRKQRRVSDSNDVSQDGDDRVSGVSPITSSELTADESYGAAGSPDVQDLDGGVSAQPHVATSEAAFLRERDRSNDAYDTLDPEDMWEKFLARATEAEPHEDEPGHVDIENDASPDPLDADASALDAHASEWMAEASLREAQTPSDGDIPEVDIEFGDDESDAESARGLQATYGVDSSRNAP